MFSHVEQRRRDQTSTICTIVWRPSTSITSAGVESNSHRWFRRVTSSLALPNADM
jgi:hypothetical protein